MKAWLFARVLRRYGTALTVEQAGRRLEVRGLLRPVLSRSWQNMEHVLGGLGQVPRGQYLYIGPPVPRVAQDDLVRCDGRTYRFRRVEPVLLGDAVAYLWGLCVTEGGEDQWSFS